MRNDCAQIADHHATMLSDAQLRQLRARMLAYARRHLRDHSLAEDAVQDTLAALLAAPRSSFRGEAQFDTYAIGVLRHKMTDALRARARERPFDDEVELAAEPTDHYAAAPDARIDRGAFWATVRGHLAGLSVRERTAFWLREVTEWDTPSVCDYLGVTPKHLHVLLHRARRNLKRRFEAVGQPAFDA